MSRSEKYGLLLLFSGLLLAGCSPFSGFPEPPPLPRSNPAETTVLENMGFTIQVGAFASVSNAAAMEIRLRERGIDAYHFRAPDGFHKIRFGDYPTYALAEKEAKDYLSRGVLGDYYIVTPLDKVQGEKALAGLRGELVATARRFLGVPYCWGGESADKGFDCSGLTMVVYRLNGLNLPRNSASQYRSGHHVDLARLRQGDLVFFATSGGDQVSHVGIYIGDGQFIHAPRPGRKVQIENLQRGYFARRFLGGRSYMAENF